ncbi:hypothetical protein G9U51_09940 [Calidifontibacter sp. DB0510]|uniref:Uncharacterized protein n=1 Tax=Metallococcus carri TaxID=1656884 RepID=A0A967B7D2_9MICO|nr:hypothetical protein [Metallococcus carri]NHN56096.1 hypothetical protein [Metallococcus carri]NOP37447.1 hypothetical protein [Calidifontibacter sp. DB2511S]
MSVLVHECRTCGHNATWHESRERAYTACRCCIAGTADPDPEPTLRPTWTSPGGRLEPLAPPGTVRNERTMHQTVTCDCEACRAAYDHHSTRSP